MKLFTFLFYILYKISVSCLDSLPQSSISWDIGSTMRFSNKIESNNFIKFKKDEKLSI